MKHRILICKAFFPINISGRAIRQNFSVYKVYCLFINHRRSSTDLADALKHLEVFSDMFSAGRLLSTIRTKLGHPGVYASEDIADIMVSYVHKSFTQFLCDKMPTIPFE